MADTRTRIINLPEATTLDSSMNFVEDSAEGSGTRRVTYDTLKGAINQNLAPAYSNAATYAVGDLCTYKGTLYSCSTAISTAEDWTAAHWTEVNVSAEISELKNTLSSAIEGGYNVYDTLQLSGNNSAVVSNNDGTYTVGTSDYGMSLFGSATLLKAGSYLLFGVPQGYSFLSTTNSHNGEIFTNDGSEPKWIVIESDTTLYLGFRISQKPNESFVIRPFLMSTKIEKNAKNIDALEQGLSDLENTLSDYNVNDVFNGVKLENETDTIRGVTVTQNEDGSVTLSGTATRGSYVSYVVPTNGLPSWFKLNKKYYVKYSGSAWFRIYKYVGSTLTLVVATKTDTEFSVDSADRLLIRITTDADVTYDETVQPRLLTAPFSDEELGVIASSAYREMTDYKNSKYAHDADNFTEKGAIFVPYDSLDTTHNWAHMPENKAFWLFCIGESGASKPLYFQIAYPYNTGLSIYKRVKSFDGWGDWERVGTTVNNTFNTYENTYNINSTPQITTDTNAYLAPTGDSTDVTASIASMLSTYGVCRLGKGNYYIKNLVMPEGAMLIGSGTATKIYMLSGDGCAIKMSDYSIVKDLMLIGGTSTVTPSASVRNRHAILWSGTYAEDGTAPYKGLIDSVYIRDFEGGGITCLNTGYGNSNSINVTNCYIQRCDAGININYWSEFNRFSGVKSHDCYYGCVNNGGNNMFVNCDFSANKLAFLMDNENDQSPNNSHGSAVGCIFNHTDNNSGIGIKILNCDNGFVFSGCQIFFSQIDIEDSDGVVISNCNFGASNCDITVNGGGAVLFIGNMHQAQPTKTITNNNVHFVNCYVRATGEAVV